MVIEDEDFWMTDKSKDSNLKMKRNLLILLVTQNDSALTREYKIKLESLRARVYLKENGFKKAKTITLMRSCA